MELVGCDGSFQLRVCLGLCARGSAYLPSACLASHGLQGMAGPAHRLPRLLQPPLALEGSCVAHSQSPTSWHFLRGAALSPVLHGVWEAAFLSRSIGAVLAAQRCQGRGSARCTRHLLDLFNRKLMSWKTTGWAAWCGAGERLSPCAGIKKGVGLVSGHAVLLSDAA